MTRSTRVLLLLALCCAFARAACGQQSPPKVEIHVRKLAEFLYLLQGTSGEDTSGGNIVASVGPDGILLVDAQYSSVSDQVWDALAALSGHEPDVRYVINTHWHRDHAEGNRRFGPTATIIAHTSVRERLTTTQTLFGQAIAPYPPDAWPKITFDDSLTLHFNGEDVRIVH